MNTDLSAVWRMLHAGKRHEVAPNASCNSVSERVHRDLMDEPDLGRVASCDLTTLELEFVTNVSLPRLFAGDPERSALAPLCVVGEAAGDIVHRFDAHRSLLQDDANVVGTECLANIAW